MVRELCGVALVFTYINLFSGTAVDGKGAALQGDGDGPAVFAKGQDVQPGADGEAESL